MKYCYSSEVTLVGHHGDAVQVAQAAWVSTDKGENRSLTAAIARARGCIKDGHGVPLEYVHYTFQIRAPLFVIVHLLRHRLTSPVQQSQRFTGGVSEVEIFGWDNDEVWRDFFKEDCEADFSLWEELLCDLGNLVATFEKLAPMLSKRGVECVSRYLPYALMANFRWHMNLREFLHVIKLRTAPEAQKETRDVVNAMLEQARVLPLHEVFFEHLKKESSTWTEPPTT